MFTEEELKQSDKRIYDKLAELKDCEFVYFFDQKYILESFVPNDKTVYIAKLLDLKEENRITIYNILFLSKVSRPYGGKHIGAIPFDFKTYMRVDSLKLPKENNYNYDDYSYYDYFEDMKEREFARWY